MNYTKKTGAAITASFEYYTIQGVDDGGAPGQICTSQNGPTFNQGSGRTTHIFAGPGQPNGSYTVMALLDVTSPSSSAGYYGIVFN